MRLRNKDKGQIDKVWKGDITDKSECGSVSFKTQKKSTKIQSNKKKTVSWTE